MRALLLVLGLLLASALGACTSPTCVTGMSVSCACTNGRVGAQVCREGVFAPCVCDAVDAGRTDASDVDAARSDARDASLEVLGVDAPALEASPTDAPALEASPPEASAPDSGPPVFSLSSAMVRNSPADIASWAETARLTRLELRSDGVHIDFTKRDGAGSWPDVPFLTPGENLQYTLWIVLQVDGVWYTSGCLQYWRGLDAMGGPPSMYAANWYYDPGRWAPMTGHQPAVGEWVGFFVAAGNHRNVTDHSTSLVLERSNVVFVRFPTDAGQSWDF